MTQMVIMNVISFMAGILTIMIGAVCFNDWTKRKGCK